MELQAWIGGLPIARGFGCGCDDADNLFQQAVASQLPTTVIPRPTSTEVASRTVSNSQLVVPGTVTYFVWSSNACRYKRLYGPLEYGVHTVRSQDSYCRSITVFGFTGSPVIVELTCKLPHKCPFVETFSPTMT